MRPVGMMQSLLKQENPLENRMSAFRPGQIINGKIIKLYPNQLAEVQVGAGKLIASLETALSANERYWFQVQAGEGQVHLKVLETPANNGKSSAVDALLQQLNLPATKDNVSLLQLFLKEQYPLTKETLTATANLLKMSDSLQDGLETIKLMLSKQLPFTKDIFLSLSSMLKNEPLSAQLTHLQSLLQRLPQTDNQEKLTSLLNEINMTEKDRVSGMVLTKLINEWLTNSEKSAASFKLLQNLGFIPKTITSEQMVNETLAKWLNNESSASTVKTLESQQPLLETIKTNRSSDFEVFTALFNNRTEQGLRQLTSIIQMTDASQLKMLSREEHDLLLKVSNEVQIDRVQWDNSHAVKEHLKELIKALGLNYEHELMNFVKQQEGEGGKNLNTLKPLLMQLLREDVPNNVKDVAEKLLFKITGFQVLSQEVGPMQQYVFQIPLSFWDKKTDLMMQWSGRKTADGKIDSNYCRVLFYLDLDFLEETIIDLQVQNRIMNITIINENKDIKQLADPFITKLKEGLAALHFQLSSVAFEKPADQKQKDERNDVFATVIAPNKVSGVDFRI